MGRGPAQHAGQHLAVDGRIAHHTPLADARPARLELGLDQDHGPAILSQQAGHGRQHQVQADEGDVDHRQIDLLRVGQRLKRAHVGALQRDHPAILAQLPG